MKHRALCCLVFFVMACTLVAFGHSKIIALKQKLNLGTGLPQPLSSLEEK